MISYSYNVEGLTADSVTWKCKGIIATENRGRFPQVVDECMRQAFLDLTGGRAVFGKPGMACRGPYSVTKLTVEEDPCPTGQRC